MGYNFIPNTLFRPIKERPRQIKQWSYLEKKRYYNLVSDHREIITFIKKNGYAPPDLTKEKLKTMIKQKLVSRDNKKGLKPHNLLSQIP